VLPGSPDFLVKWRDYIRWDLRLHFKNYSIPELSVSSGLCASCHVSSMPSFLTGLPNDMLVTDLYTSWKNSSYAEEGQTCVTCHMPNRSRDIRGFLYPDHRIPGLNIGISLTIEGDEETLRGVKQFEDFTRELATGSTPWPDSIPFLEMAIEAPDPLGHGSPLPLVVKTTNSRVGHYFHAGPNSLNEVWLEVIVKDASDRVLFHSGGLSEKNREIDPMAHRIGARVLDAKGKVIRDCSIWRVAGVEGARRIKPFETIEDRYDVTLPPDAKGPLTAQARWHHRRASQSFVDWAFGGKGPTLPSVELASVTKVIQLSGTPQRVSLNASREPHAGFLQVRHSAPSATSEKSPELNP